MRHTVQRVLDLGCGPGACRAGLRRQFPQAQWLGVDLSEAMLRSAGRAGPAARLARWLRTVAPPRGGADLRICASAEQLPLADASIDLVFSNLMLHWHPAPHEVIGEMARILRPGGLVLFSSYGPDTLAELRRACLDVLPGARPMPFVDMHDFGDMLVAAGFESPVMEVETLTLTYADPGRLIAEVRALGGNPRRDRAAALPSGRQARALRQRLQAATDQHGRIALHFEIVIGHGWKATPRVDGLQTVAMPRSRRPPA
jgi:malonyl-CoA O-methyltransferase